MSARKLSRSSYAIWNPLVAIEAVGGIGSMVDAFTH
jgi:hypothetical protein